MMHLASHHSHRRPRARHAFALALVVTLLLVLASPLALAQDGPVLDTGLVQTALLPDGFVGADSGAGTGFVYDGDAGLFEGQFLVGLGPDTVIGQPYSSSDGAPPAEWTSTSGVTAIAPPLGFDQAVETTFEAVSGEVAVTVRAFAATDDPFVILEYAVTNTSGGPLDAVYLGLFADWDVGDFAQNRGAFTAGSDLLFVFDQSEVSTNVFGTAVLNSATAPVSGYSLSADVTDAGLYTALSTTGVGAEPAADRRTVLGMGPYAFAPDERVVVRLALVGAPSRTTAGTNAGDAARALAPILDSGVIRTQLRDDGHLFDAREGGTLGFLFNDESALFESVLMVGVAPDQVYGLPYFREDNGWTSPSTASLIPYPPAGSATAAESFFESEDGRLDVTVLARAPEGAAYAYLDYTITNVSDEPFDAMYIGTFADWDIGGASSFTTNLGDIDSEINMIYMFDDATDTHYGIVAAPSDGAMQPVTGYAFEVISAVSFSSVEKYVAALYAAMTTITPAPTEPEDMVTYQSTGPYSLAPGERLQLQFIVVAGADREALFANARQALPVGTDEAARPTAHRLDAAYPNPVTRSTTLGFALPAPERVRLSVYDVLGRRVAVVLDEVRPAGTHAVRFDAAGLASGPYLTRLQTGTASLTQRFVVVR